jgi:hypothetical protein
MPTTSADIRKLALSHDGVEELDHFGRPAFRTRRRIFAVIRPDGLFLHLPEERKAFLLEADPATFVRYMWGKRANVIVQPARVSRKELAALIAEAWAFNRPVAKKKKSAPAKRAAARPVRRGKSAAGRGTG